MMKEIEVGLSFNPEVSLASHGHGIGCWQEERTVERKKKRLLEVETNLRTDSVGLFINAN